jgi:hypothetical protein
MTDEFKTGPTTTKEEFVNAYAAGKAAYQANSWRGMRWIVPIVAILIGTVTRHYGLPWYEVVAVFAALGLALSFFSRRFRASRN